ncbi:hypothetical protein KUCAC02_025063, partial [Chaenocephalus aceratus]
TPIVSIPRIRHKAASLTRLESFQPEAAPHKELSSTMCLRWCSHNVGSGKWRNVLVLLSRANPIVLTHSIEYLTPLSYYLPSLPHTFPDGSVNSSEYELVVRQLRLCQTAQNGNTALSGDAIIRQTIMGFNGQCCNSLDFNRCRAIRASEAKALEESRRRNTGTCLELCTNWSPAVIEYILFVQHTWQIQATQPEMLIEDERLMNDWAEWLHTMPTIIIAAVGRKDPERLWAA